jgi:hypothetical protein
VSDSTTPLKQCSRKGQCVHPGGAWQPATSEYFGIQHRRKDGLNPQCQSCRAEYRRTHKEQLRVENKHSYEKDMASGKRQAYVVAYRETHREHISDYQRRYRKENHRKLSIYHAEHYREHREEISEKTRIHRRLHIDVKRVNNRNRVARKKSLPATFTKRDWQRAVEYFHGRCAVCGRQVNDLFGTHTLSLDHWIPLSSPDCPGTVPTNILPLCHGLNGCNNQKHDKDPRTWVIEKFGKRKGAAILKHIDDYFNSLPPAAD